MPIVAFAPAPGSQYRAGLEPAAESETTMYFSFGREQDALVTSRIAVTGEPRSLRYFQAHWSIQAPNARLIDHWAGFMALRYVSGYATDWDELPETIREQAVWIDPFFSDDPRSLIYQIQQWEPGWEYQLDPLRELILLP